MLPTRCRADTQDAVQEVFLRFASSDSARIIPPPTCLFRTVDHACTDRLQCRPPYQPLNRQLPVPKEDAAACEEREPIERLLAEQADGIRLRTAGNLRFSETARLPRHNRQVAAPIRDRPIARDDKPLKTVPHAPNFHRISRTCSAVMPQTNPRATYDTTGRNARPAQLPEHLRRRPRARVPLSPQLRDRILRAAAGCRNHHPFRIAAVMLSGAVVPCLGLRTPVRAARGCLREAVIALGDGSALHPEARIRTKPTENFSYTAPHETFVSPPLPTVCDGPSPRWRVEKKRQESSLQWKPDLCMVARHKRRHSPPARCQAAEEPSRLLDPRQQLPISKKEYTRPIPAPRTTLFSRPAPSGLRESHPHWGITARAPTCSTHRLAKVTRSVKMRSTVRPNGCPTHASLLTGDGARTTLKTERIDYDLPVDTARIAPLPTASNGLTTSSL